MQESRNSDFLRLRNLGFIGLYTRSPGFQDLLSCLGVIQGSGA